MHGFIVITRWFAQKIETRYSAKPPRRFDQETNISLLRELGQRVDELSEALEMGLGGVDAAVAVGTLANMIAFNVEKGLGDSASEPELVPEGTEVENLSEVAVLEDAQVEELPQTTVIAEPETVLDVSQTSPPKRKPGRPKLYR